MVLTRPTEVACLQCDELVLMHPLRERERARCPRCGHVLAYYPAGGLTRPLAFAIASLMLLPTALLLPFLTMSVSGIERSIRLPDAIISLIEFDAPGIGVLVLLFVIVIPATMMLLAIVLIAMLDRGGRRDVMAWMAKVMFRLNQWNMAEVFAIGVIVSLVKLAAMATIILGTAFWSYLGFGACFVVAMANLDGFTIWYRIDARD